MGARTLETEQVIRVPDVSASSLRQVPSTEPPSVPMAQPLALAVRYEWTVLPPRVPAGAGEDALCVRWRKLDESWGLRLARVREALAAAGEHRGRLGRTFARLVGAVLGFDRTHTMLETRLDALEAQRPSTVGPAGARELLEQLGVLEADTRKLQADQQEAERKAHEDNEREKQQAVWRERVDTAKRDLPERRTALAAVESRRADLEASLRAIEASLKSPDEKARKDLTAQKHKFSDELQCAAKECTQLREAIMALEKQAAERFEFRPPPASMVRPAQSGGRFVPAASGVHPDADVPDEAPPEVSSLRSHKGQRYLVIDTWEQLSAGERTAARLRAHLVASEKV